MVNFTRTPNQLGNLLGPQIRQPYLPGANVPSPSPWWSSPFISGVPNPGSRQPRPLPTLPNIAPVPGMHFIPGVPSPAYRQSTARFPSGKAGGFIPFRPSTHILPTPGGQPATNYPSPATHFTPSATPSYTPPTFQIQQQLQNFMPQLQQFMTMLPQLQQIISILPQLMNLLNLLGGGR